MSAKPSSTMNKAKKQKIILFAMIGLFAVAGLYQFGLVPLLDGVTELEAAKETRLAELRKAEKLIKNRLLMQKDAAAMRSQTEHVLATELPPTDNALAWAQQAVYAQTRAMKLAVNSIVEDQSSGGVWDAPDLGKKVFKPYSIRIELTASFEEARDLVRALQNSNPRLSISAIGISADGRTPERHHLTMTLEWPSWRDASQAANPFGVPVEEKKGT